MGHVFGDDPSRRVCGGDVSLTARHRMVTRKDDVVYAHNSTAPLSADLLAAATRRHGTRRAGGDILRQTGDARRESSRGVHFGRAAEGRTPGALGSFARVGGGGTKIEAPSSPRRRRRRRRFLCMRVAVVLFVLLRFSSHRRDLSAALWRLRGLLSPTCALFHASRPRQLKQLGRGAACDSETRA